jgi:acyl-CoA thioesterase-1
LVLETGANDGLRGQDPDSLEANIRAILLRASELRPKPRLVLVGMEAPPNLGQNYTTRFREVYRRVAGETGAAFVPFLLEGVAGVDSLNQGDGIHPTREGHHVIAETLWSVLRPVLLER